MDVLEKAKELGESLANSEEYKRMKLAEAAQAHDDEASRLLAAYNERTNEFAAQIKAKQPTQEELEHYRNELTAEFNKISENPVIKEYIESQKAFDELMKKINSIIAFYVVPQDKGGSCSGSCSSCSGCH